MAKDLEDMPESVRKLSREIDRLKEEVENNPEKSPSLKAGDSDDAGTGRSADDIKEEIEDVQENVEKIDTRSKQQLEEEKNDSSSQNTVEKSEDDPDTDIEQFRDRLRKAKAAAEDGDLDEARNMYSSLSAKFRGLKAQGKTEPLDEKMMRKVHRKVTRAKDEPDTDVDI